MVKSSQAATTADIATCDDEPIHIPGAILPNGAMLVMDPVTLEVLQCAGDTMGLLGLSRTALLGRTADLIFRPERAFLLRELAAKLPLNTPRHLLDPTLRVETDSPLDASLHRSGDVLVLELEQADLTDRFSGAPLSAVRAMVKGFDDATSLRALCEMAARRVREVAVYDRVLVYRFLDDDSGWVIAESRQPHLESFLNLHYPAADIPRQARALYLKNWLRLITEVDYKSAPLTPPVNPRTGAPLDMSHAVLRDVSPIHREYLRNMGIDASMSISIICGGRLWGLIACHHHSPRRLPRHLRAVCELFGSMFSLQLEAREKGEEFDARLASWMVMQNLLLNLASADNYADALTGQSSHLLDYIHGSDAGLSGPEPGGVAVCIEGRLTIAGATPEVAQVAALIAWLNSHMATSPGVFSTDRLAELWPPAAAFRELASGILVIAASHAASDYVIWFRPEIIASVQWAGRPAKLVVSGPQGRRLSPRKSFEIWQETVVGRSVPWTKAETDAALDLRLALLDVALRRIEEATRARRQAARHDGQLMAELDDRVKNTLADIHALDDQASENAASLAGFVEGLEGRIRSMAKAHSLLCESRWEGVFLDQLLREELGPYEGRESGVTLGGPSVFLTPRCALSLSLAIHELATNAVKYGAFAKPGGGVAVSWTLGTSRDLDLQWRETNGPPVVKPTRTGFGSALIQRALAIETGGRALIQYPQAGLCCDIWLPAASIGNPKPTSRA